MKAWTALPFASVLLACAPEQQAANVENAATKVATSGKTEVAIADLPPAVLAAAREVEPGFQPAEAEQETRDGRRYYDVEGTANDGSEVEFDIMDDAGTWRVVERQRDVAFAAVPKQVRATFDGAKAGFAPVRVIESRQNDGVIIYELFGPAPEGSEQPKVEVKYDGRTTELLTKEWAH